MLFRDAPGTSTATRREDYSPPPYWIDTVELSFDLDPAQTRVLNRMRLRRNTDLPGQPLRPGVSVTDACISLAQTAPVLGALAAAVRARRAHVA